MAERTYLFVVTRDLRNHPSARYTLRIALGRIRRGDEVTVFITDDAVPGALMDSTPVAELLEAGIRVLIDAQGQRLSDQEIANLGGNVATEDDLASLLLTPRIHAEWC